MSYAKSIARSNGSSSLLPSLTTSAFMLSMRNAMFILGMIGAATIVTPAWADVPPDDSAGCVSKAAGAACQKDDMSNGTCTSATCTKLDYSMGTPPTSVEYACLLCKSGSNGAGASGSQPSDDEGGCSMKSGGVVGAAGAWILGAAVLMFARRTRARKRQP